MVSDCAKIKWWHQCNPYVQTRPVIVKDINIETQLISNKKSSGDSGGTFFPTSVTFRSLCVARCKPSWLWYARAAWCRLSSAPRPICKDFLFCWKLPCQLSSFQPDDRHNTCSIMLKSRSDKRLQSANVYKCIIFNETIVQLFTCEPL